MALLAALVVAAGCAPAAVPPPAPAPATPVPAAVPKAPGPEDAAWAKMVETAKREGTLTMYSFSMVGDTGIKVKQAFKRATGLEIEHITASGAPLIERIKAERRAGIQIASVLATANVLVFQAKMEGLTQAAGNLPAVQDKDKWRFGPTLDKEGHILFSAVAFIGPWVNTQLVKREEEPKSWRDLLGPRFKGEIGMADPDTTPTPVSVYYRLLKEGVLNEADFRELGKGVRFQVNIRQASDALARGEVAVSWSNTASAMSPFLKAGAPVKAMDMEEGTIAIQSSAVVLLSGAPHPNAGRVFLNWWFSDEGQVVFHEAYGTESTRKGVPNFIPAPGRISPKKVYVESPEDTEKVATLQRDRVLKKLLVGR